MDNCPFDYFVALMSISGPLLRELHTQEADFCRSLAELEPAEGIRMLRHITGLSQSAFARKFEVSLATVRGWEQGMTNPPKCVFHLMAYVIYTNFCSQNNSGQAAPPVS